MNPAALVKEILSDADAWDLFRTWAHPRHHTDVSMAIKVWAAYKSRDYYRLVEIFQIGALTDAYGLKEWVAKNQIRRDVRKSLEEL